MNEAVIRERLLELCETLAGPAEPPDKGQQGEGMYIPQFGHGKTSVQDAVETLQVQMKYLMFDLEATRRENRYLRQMLEGRPNPGGGKEPGAS